MGICSIISEWRKYNFVMCNDFPAKFQTWPNVQGFGGSANGAKRDSETIAEVEEEGTTPFARANDVTTVNDDVTVVESEDRYQSLLKVIENLEAVSANFLAFFLEPAFS